MLKSKIDTNIVGLYIKIETILGETLEGEIFAFDEELNLLAICNKFINK
jgi:hypothetical protein